MDSAKQTAAPGFLAPEGESEKKKRNKRDSEGQQNKGWERRLKRLFFVFMGYEKTLK